MGKQQITDYQKKASYISTDNSHLGLVVYSSDESYEPEDVIVQAGVTFKRVDEIHINVSLIPDDVRDRLAAATLEAFKRSCRDPDFVRKLEERTEQRKKQKSVPESETK